MNLSNETVISTSSVRKVYGNSETGVEALKGIDLDIQANEFFTLLGPSGCGKTTLLRLIAGFEYPTSGNIRLFGDDIGNLPPYRRPINTVFQHYALFPHMSVARNVAFGLEGLKWNKPKIDDTVREMLELVQLAHLADRSPEQLSGGQKQRVALARALAPHPKVLLLDEPLSALDLKLRQSMRTELKRIQVKTGITFIYVTHDQEEALSMSDRVAVLSNGEVQQIGHPETIYERPSNRFVADFIGETNFLDVEVGKQNGSGISCITSGGIEFVCEPIDGISAGDNRTISLRPEKIRITDPANPNSLQAKVKERIYLGTDLQYTLTLADDLEVIIRTQNAEGDSLRAEVGQNAGVLIESGAARLLTD